jgi:hypothetical protein
MSKAVKIVQFSLWKRGFDVEQAEEELTYLVNQGWRIVAAGGCATSANPTHKVGWAEGYGFVVLETEFQDEIP